MSDNFFCPLPWNHLFFKPNGKVQACCETYDTQFDPSETIEATANDPILKKLRLDLLNPKIKPEICKRCIERETYQDFSVRLSSMNIHKDWTEQKARAVTEADGELKKFRLENVDIRWSNLCNYKCRFCSLASSNTWLQDQHNLKHIPGYNKNFDKFNPKTGIAEYDMDWQDLKKHLPYLKYVKLAGGEPTIMPGTYQLLEELIKIGNTSCQISLITNGTTVKFGNKDLLKLFTNFKGLTKIQVSLDGMGKAHEWLRSGKEDWDIIKNNLVLFKEYADANNWHINFHTGISWMNLYNLAEFILEYPDWNHIFNIVTHPQEMSIGKFYKAELMEAETYYINLIKKIEKRQDISTRIQRNIVERLTTVQKAITNAIRKTKQDIDMNMFREVHGILDKSRSQNFAKAFPEWSHYA